MYENDHVQENIRGGKREQTVMKGCFCGKMYQESSMGAEAERGLW